MLEDDEQLPTPKELAATALGNLRSSESIPVLAAQMNKAAKAKEHSLAIACAEALARLGDQQGFPVIVKCSQLKSKPEVRTLAAQALCYVNAAGMFSLMQEAIKDKYYEVRRAAVEAVYYLGTVDAAELLVKAITDRDEIAANNATVYLQRISGEKFEEPREIQQWWKTSRKRFKPRVGYRLGVPIQLSVFADMIKDPLAKFDIVREFSIYTGRQFGADVYIRAHLDEISAEVSRLARELAAQYEEGKIYKAGVQVDLAAIMKDAK
jgi:HEAT repeat protein